MFPDMFEYRTNAHMMGGSQYGKSKLCQLQIQEHIIDSNGVCGIDCHGPLYDSLTSYLARVRPRRPVYLLNLSDATHIIPVPLFRCRPGDDPAAHASRIADTLIKAWGVDNTDAAPTYDRIISMLVLYANVKNIPLHLAEKLLYLHNHELRNDAISLEQDDAIRSHWLQLQFLAAQRYGSQFDHEVKSTLNRLRRFIGTRVMRLTLGSDGPGLDLDRAIDEKAIILVNAAESGQLSHQSRAAFLSLLLSEFLNVAIRRAREERPFFIFADECQTYVNSDAARLLDQTIKTGLRITFVHHHLNEDAFNKHPEIADSLEQNAGIKITFGGSPVESAKHIAERDHLREINERRIKETRYHTITKHRLEEFTTEMQAEGESEGETDGDSSSDSFSEFSGHSCHGELGGASDSMGFMFGNSSIHAATRGRSAMRGITKGTRYAPYNELEETGKDEWSREDKISQIAHRIRTIEPQQCEITVPREDPFIFEIPDVHDTLLFPETVLRYVVSTYQALSAPPIHEADQILREDEARFLERGEHYATNSGRPDRKAPAKKKQARLHRAG